MYDRWRYRCCYRRSCELLIISAAAGAADACPPQYSWIYNSIKSQKGIIGIMDSFKDNALAYAELIKLIFQGFKAMILNLINIDITSLGVVSSGVQAAGVSLAGLFFAMEMISQIASKFIERIEDAIQLCIKLIVAKIIIENSTSITGGIYSMFRNLGSIAIDEGFSAITSTISSTITEERLTASKGMLGEGYIFSCFILLIVSIVITVMLIMLTVEIMGIAFEIGIHQAVSPIALSTLCNSTARSAGISFIKSYSAVCLQTTIIGTIFSVYTSFSDKILIDPNMKDGANITLAERISSAGAFGMIYSYLSPLIGLMILCITVRKSSDLTKRMFGA